MRSMHSWDDQGAEIIPAESQANLQAVVARAMEIGINHFETAHAYGTSERQLGQALLDYPRKSYVLQTKIQPRANPDQFAQEFERSLERLQHETVDLLAIHGINDYRSLWYAIRPGGCLHIARRLQQEGRVGHVGFSGHGPVDVLLDAVNHENCGGFDYLNLHWYYIFQIHETVLKRAHERNMGIFIISPTDKGGQLQSPPALLRRLCAPLSPISFNDLYCLARPEIATISVGAARPEDFDEHVKSLDKMGDAGELIAAIDKRLRVQMQTATGFERPDCFFQCCRSWERTPGYVNIPFVLWLGFLALGWDLTDYARRRYRGLGVDMPWIQGMPASNLDQYDFSKIGLQQWFTAETLRQQLMKIHQCLK